ncbi:MAG: hypothetical protein MI739_09070 [Bacteroidales bacterium]|nr:hypothetical protein [Bacteroidales bacterium]
MKNVNLLKVLATLTLVLLISGAYAQTPDQTPALAKAPDLVREPTHYEYKGELSKTGGEHKVTVGKKIPFYVEPDAYFNPEYKVGDGWLINSSFEWSFSDPENSDLTMPEGANPSIEVPALPNEYTPTENMKDILFNEVGTYKLGVREVSATGCQGDWQTQDIEVINAPSCSFGNEDDVDNNCGDLAATDVKFDIAINGATNYKVDWTINVDNLSADKVTILDKLDGSDGTFDDLDEETVDADFPASGNDLVLTNQAFPVVNGKVTRYTFTLTGINDEVSRRSDYVAGGRKWPVLATAWENHPAAADDKFVIIVLPAPATGPIYHLDI